jgi:hypothetical protein
MRLKRQCTYGRPDGWRCTVLSGTSKRGFVLVQWLNGPLKGREARIEAASLTEEIS